MKRLLIMLAVFFIMISLSVTEILFTQTFYSRLYDRLDVLEASMEANENALDNADTSEKMRAALGYWEKNKNFVMVLGNHSVIRIADEKLESLEKLIRLNEKSDAFVTVAMAKNYVYELKNDTFPHLVNIL